MDPSYGKPLVWATTYSNKVSNGEWGMVEISNFGETTGFLVDLWEILSHVPFP